ncbi:MAG TPA: hypothetical protein VGQ99_22310 [Tepidisphaeraceae bacterium]|jgi:hypothetical protein|nr:hypothetical protein [Tepidisphaeraceae bacterium]
MKRRKEIFGHVMVEALEERRLMSATAGDLTAEGDATAAKEQFERTKPHVNCACYVPSSSDGGAYVFTTDGRASGM